MLIAAIGICEDPRLRLDTLVHVEDRDGNSKPRLRRAVISVNDASDYMEQPNFGGNGCVNINFSIEAA